MRSLPAFNPVRPECRATRGASRGMRVARYTAVAALAMNGLKMQRALSYARSVRPECRATRGVSRDSVARYTVSAFTGRQGTSTVDRKSVGYGKRGEVPGGRRGRLYSKKIINVSIRANRKN